MSKTIVIKIKNQIQRHRTSQQTTKIFNG